MRARVVLPAWLAAALVCALIAPAYAQKDAPPDAKQSATTQPETLDRVDAIVNDSVLLESDVEEEMNFAAFEPFDQKDGADSRQLAMRRLIDRSLVLQQMKLQPNATQVSDDALDKQLYDLRRTLPACAKYNCATDKGWQEFCAAHGFTLEQVRDRWRSRMAVLTFVEQRFRTGIRISAAEITDYYDKQFVPKFTEKKLTAPPLAKVSDRIQELLLQQRVTALLNEWLGSLREEGSVQILDPRDIPPPEKAATDTAAPDSVAPGSVPAGSAAPVPPVPAATPPVVTPKETAK